MRPRWRRHERGEEKKRETENKFLGCKKKESEEEERLGELKDLAEERERGRDSDLIKKYSLKTREKGEEEGERKRKMN